MMFAFLVYAHIYDLPLTIFRMMQASGCCTGTSVFTVPYATTHFITPAFFAASFTISMLGDNHDFWTKAHAKNHGSIYPLYFGAALGAQVLLRVVLVYRMQALAESVSTVIEETQSLLTSDVEKATSYATAPFENKREEEEKEKPCAGCCR